MRLARDRAERNGPGGEAEPDALRRLDLADQHRRSSSLARRCEPEQAANGEQLLGLLVADLGIGPVLVGEVAAHRVLERRYRRGGPRMVFTAHAKLILAADVEGMAIDRRIAE